MNIDQSELYLLYINGIDSTISANYCEAFQISELFFELVTIFKIIVALGLCKLGGGGICAEQHPL